MYNIQVRQKIAAGLTQKFTKKFHSAGVLETVSFRFYPGQQLDLEIMARVNRLGGSYVNIFNYTDGSLSLVAGDDDYFRETVGIPINRGEQLELIVTNKSVVPLGGDADDYIYDFNVHAFINEAVI